MDLVNLAYNASPTEMVNGWQLYQYAGTAFIFAVLIGAFIFFLVCEVRMARPTRFKGPALTGTAELLSLAPAGGLAAFGATSYRRPVYWIGLRVEIPGRPPYDVTVTTPVGSGWLWERAARPGGTYAAQVDSANPENVRFDYRQPVGTPPGWWYPDPSGAQAQRYWDGRQWTASVQPPQD
jgi:hypothetical protein